MKKFLLFTLSSFLFIYSIRAQNSANTIKHWEIKGKTSINFNENYFSNWAAGGQNAYGGVGQFSMNADYNKGKVFWTNSIKMALGYSLIGNSKPMKTDDQIQIFSTYKLNWKKNWLFSVMASIQTQFANGYNYAVDSTTPISGFLSPITIDLGPGLQYKPSKHFDVNLSPATARIIYVNNQRLADAGAFGLTPAVKDSLGNIIKHAHKAFFAFGARVYAKLDYDIAKNLNLKSQLSLFSDYLNNPQNIVVDWQNVLGMKVNSWLNVDISTQMLYDDRVMITDKYGNTGPRLQFKQLLLIGLSYSF